MRCGTGHSPQLSAAERVRNFADREHIVANDFQSRRDGHATQDLLMGRWTIPPSRSSPRDCDDVAWSQAEPLTSRTVQWASGGERTGADGAGQSAPDPTWTVKDVHGKLTVLRSLADFKVLLDDVLARPTCEAELVLTGA